MLAVPATALPNCSLSRSLVALSCWQAALGYAALHALFPGQNPVLAREDAWAHATGAPEPGGLLLATPDAPRLIGEEYWQAGGRG